MKHDEQQKIILGDTQSVLNQTAVTSRSSKDVSVGISYSAANTGSVYPEPTKSFSPEQLDIIQNQAASKASRTLGASMADNINRHGINTSDAGANFHYRPTRYFTSYLFQPKLVQSQRVRSITRVARIIAIGILMAWGISQL